MSISEDDFARITAEYLKQKASMQKTNFKFSIKFSQALQSGAFAFEGYQAFDNADEFLHNDEGAKRLLAMLQSVERVFEADGRKLASHIPNNMQALATRKKFDDTSATAK